MADFRALLANVSGIFHYAWPAQVRRRRYTRESVKRYLRRQIEPTDSDAAAIRRALEGLPLLVRDPQVARRFQGFQRYAEILPRIVFLYLRGDDPKQIARGLNFLATDYGVEAVVDIAAEIVAERLNAGNFHPSPAVS